MATAGLFPDRKQHNVSLHSVFLGRPGTGKTTLCKIFGSLLRQAGALSKGYVVVVCDRGTFIGTLCGDEERSVRQVVKMTQGGVLMIDEAYLLNGKSKHAPEEVVKEFHAPQSFMYVDFDLYNFHCDMICNFIPSYLFIVTKQHTFISRMADFDNC